MAPRATVRRQTKNTKEAGAAPSQGQVVHRASTNKKPAWIPQEKDVVRIPGGGGIGKDLEGQVLMCNVPGDGYIKVAISNDEKNPPDWRGKNWPGRAAMVEFLFRPIPEEDLEPEGAADSPPDSPEPVGESEDEGSDAGAAFSEAAPAVSEEAEAAPSDQEMAEEVADVPEEMAEEMAEEEVQPLVPQDEGTWGEILGFLQEQGVSPVAIAMARQAHKLRVLRGRFDAEEAVRYAAAIARLHPDMPADAPGFFAEALQYLSRRGPGGVQVRSSLDEAIQRLRQEYPKGKSRELLERALTVQDSLKNVPIPPAKIGPYTIYRNVESWATVPVWGVWAKPEDLPTGAKDGHIGTFDYVGGQYKPRPVWGASKPPMLSSPEAAVGWLVMTWQKQTGDPAPGLTAPFLGPGHATVGEEIAYWKGLQAEGKTVLPQGIHDRRRWAVAEAIALAEKDMGLVSWKGRGRTAAQVQEKPAWKSQGPVLVAGFRNAEAWLVEEIQEGEWIVLFRERGKEDAIDPKHPLPFPTAEEAARYIGRRCMGDHEAADRDVWRTGALGLEGWLAYGEAVEGRKIAALRRREIPEAPETVPETARETLDLGAEFEEEPEEVHGLKGPKGKKVAPGPAGYSVWEFGEGFRCYHDETGLVLRDMLDEPADFWSEKAALAHLRDVQRGLDAEAHERREADEKDEEADDEPDQGGGQPSLLEEPEQPKRGYHVGAMMTGDLPLGGAQILSYFTERTEDSLRKKYPDAGHDSFGGVVYLLTGEDGFRLRRHGGVGFPVDRPLTDETYPTRAEAVAAARDWLWREDPLRSSHYQYHFGCRQTLYGFLTYNEYMRAVLREAGFNYKLVETADGRFHSVDYGVSPTPDGQGVYAAHAPLSEERAVLRFDDIARIWNGMHHTREGRIGSGSIVWCRDDIPAFPRPDFTETVDEKGAVAWTLPDGRGFVVYPNEQRHYTVTRKDTHGFHSYADNLAEARAQCGVPAAPLGTDAVEPEPRVVAQRFHKDGVVLFGVEPDVDGDVRVLYRQPGKDWMYSSTVKDEAEALDWVRSHWGTAPDGILWVFADGYPGMPEVPHRRFVVDPKRLREGTFSDGKLLFQGDIHASLSSHRVSDRDRDLTRAPRIAQPFEHDGRLWMATGCDGRVAAACELVPLKEWEGPVLRYEDLPRDAKGAALHGYHGLRVTVSRRNWYVCRGAEATFEAWRVDPKEIYHHAPAPDTDDTAKAGVWPPGVEPCAWDSIHAPRSVVGTRDGSWQIIAGCLKDETGRLRFRLYGLYQGGDRFEPLQDEVYDTPRLAWAAFGTPGNRPALPDVPPAEAPVAETPVETPAEAPVEEPAPVTALQPADPPAEEEERPELVLAPPDVTPRRRRKVLV